MNRPSTRSSRYPRAARAARVFARIPLGWPMGGGRAVSLLFAFAIALGGVTPASPANNESAASALTLHPTAEVLGDGIFLDQIVRLVDEQPLPHVRLAPAPTLGKAAVFTRAQVTDWIREHASDFATTNWTGADRIRIGRRARSLDEIGLRDFLCLTLQREVVKDRGELELRLLRPWTAVLVPDEPLTLRVIDMPATGPSANFIVRFEILCGDERLGQWQAPVSARVWRSIPVARAPLRRGQLVIEAPLSLERRDVLTLRDAPGLFAFDDPSLELVENIQAGQPVLARSVRPRPVIQRGQLVEGLVQDGGLTIALKVEALNDGLPGQVVRVRNPSTRREFSGKVLNEQTILIPR
ncbi:MAG: flagellar basal body P-ring formation protein FlgA [Verrucomicrobiales bacterium]|nr:flagellar basal body P-ring formation protein FlgA [Verrucomicrobiales bacterium]